MSAVIDDPISFAGRVLSAFQVAVLGVDRRTLIRYASPAATRVVGREIDDLLGVRVDEVLGTSRPESGMPDHVAGHPVHECIRDGAVRTGMRSVLWPERQDGRVVRYSAARVTKGTEVIGALIAIEDPTAPGQLTPAVMNARKLESLGRIAAGVAHEINTPTQYVNDNVHFLYEAFGILQELVDAGERVVEATSQGGSAADAIAVYAAKAERADVSDLAREIPLALEQTLDGLGRIARIAGALKEFLHPAGEEKTAADLNRAIENAVAVCRNEWRYVAEVELDLEKGLPGVPCWIDELRQVILNLVTNAAHSIAEKGESASGQLGQISISTRSVDGWVEMVVSDSGMGIPAHLLEVVFDPFFTTKEAGRGTGQGLALARSVVVDKHGGSIEVKSQPGQGSRFTVRLPLNKKRTSH